MHLGALISIRNGLGGASVLLVLATTALCAPRAGTPGAASGTGRPGAATERAMSSAVEIRELIGTGRRTLVKSPEYKTSITKSSTRARDWAQITVKFDTAPEWIDVLSMDFQVMSMTKVDGKVQFSIYHQLVEHLDVARGRDHLTAVFLSPAAVVRYGVPVAVHVSVLMDGKVVAKADDVDPSAKTLPPNWWEDRKVLERDNVKVREGYLLRLSQTPFVFVNVDDYEVMR